MPWNSSFFCIDSCRYSYSYTQQEQPVSCTCFSQKSHFPHSTRTKLFYVLKILATNVLRFLTSNYIGKKKTKKEKNLEIKHFPFYICCSSSLASFSFLFFSLFPNDFFLLLLPSLLSYLLFSPPSSAPKRKGEMRCAGQPLSLSLSETGEWVGHTFKMSRLRLGLLRLQLAQLFLSCTTNTANGFSSGSSAQAFARVFPFPIQL